MAADLVQQTGGAERFDHVGGVAGRGPVGAERHIDAGFLEPADRTDAAAELHVGQRVMSDRAVPVAEQLDVMLGQPDRVVHGEARRQHPDIVQVLDQGLAVKCMSRDGLDFGFQHVGMDRQLVTGGQLGRGAQQVVAATLRARGRRDDLQQTSMTLPCAVMALEQRDLRLCRGRRQRVQFGGEPGGHDLAQIGHAVEKRPVPHGHGDDRAQARVAIGLGGAVHRLGGDGDMQEVVLHGGNTATDRLHRADHGAQVVLPFAQMRHAERRIALHEPKLEGQVVVGALLEALVGMHMRVD